MDGRVLRARIFPFSFQIKVSNFNLVKPLLFSSVCYSAPKFIFHHAGKPFEEPFGSNMSLCAKATLAVLKVMVAQSLMKNLVRNYTKDNFPMFV